MANADSELIWEGQEGGDSLRLWRLQPGLSYELEVSGYYSFDMTLALRADTVESLARALANCFEADGGDGS